jgi:hypothetical protein
MSSIPRRIAPPLVGACALALGACGGTSDKDQITNLIKDVGKHPGNLCTKYATPQLLTQAGGQARCLAAASQPGAVDTSTQVLSVAVNGSTATASIHSKTGSNTVRFVKQNGSWKVTNAGG